MSDTEEQIQKAVVQYVRARYPKNAMCFSVPNEHYTNPIRGMRLNAMGRVAGIPDLTLVKKCEDGPKYLHLELKAKKGRLSRSQKETIPKLENLGCNVRVAYGVNHAMCEIDKFMF